jgi:superfamily II DNA or RNA helicase
MSEELTDSCGLYVAHHPWLDTPFGPLTLFKVGFSGSLGRRLRDDSYVTCFSPEWRYICTFETENAESAHLLETAVLNAVRATRPWGNELVQMGAEKISELAEQLASDLGIPYIRRDTPRYVYVAPVRPAGEPEDNVHVANVANVIHRKLPAIFECEVVNNERVPPTLALDELEAADSLLLPEELIDSDGKVVEPLEERPYQTIAAKAAIRELETTGRTILQMACRCGKTKVAYDVVRDFANRVPSDAPFLAYFLVPGLSLARQTVQKMLRYGWDGEILVVGSDPRPIGSLTMTTNQGEIERWVARASFARLCSASTAQILPKICISTYQSSELLPDAADLIIFDEAHRVCGGNTARPFNHVLLNHTHGMRLCMTATPRYDGEIMMRNRELFGGVAYAYHLRRGIDAGYVNDFRLELVTNNAISGATPNGVASSPEDVTQRLAAQILRAAKSLVRGPHTVRLLVFCRTIQHAEDLCRLVRELSTTEGTPALCLAAHSRLPNAVVAQTLRRFVSNNIASGATPIRILFNCRLFQEGVEIPALNAVFFAAPRHSPRDIIQSLCRPLNAQPGKPQSAVFIPVDDAPHLAVNHPENLKRFASIVPFVDALLEEDPALYQFLLGGDGEINPESPTVYPIDVLGRHSLQGKYDGRAVLGAVRRAVRYGTSVAARPIDRLLRTDRIPWAGGFAQLRYTVVLCGRYPKTVDIADFTLLAQITEEQANGDIYELRDILRCEKSKGAVHPFPFHRWYRWAADACNADNSLEPYQMRALESLPGWDPYGIEGPYPWRESLDFLEKWICEHGEPPMVEINRGGYIGLEATPMERLSGVLTTVNQSDGKDNKRGKKPGSGFTLAPDKRRALDELCDRVNHCFSETAQKDKFPRFKEMRWRKDRTSTGSLVEDAKGNYIGRKTFIQEAFDRFKTERARNKKASEYINRWFPGYFEGKHNRQERQDVWDQKLMPLKKNMLKK